MRTSIKKALSLIVVLVMLLTMIPAGMIAVSADEAPTIDLSNYDQAEKYVINNLADWELIAASDKDFAGIVIELATDIDAGGYTELLRPENLTAEGAPARRNGVKPTSGFEEASTFAATFPTLFKNFAGTFDGKGHTIKNARVEEGLIAAVTGDGAEILNVNIDNVIASDFIDYVEFGIVAGKAEGSLTFRNVHVTNGLIPCNTFNSMHFNAGGGFLGLADSAGTDVTDACLTIEDCSIDASVAVSGDHSSFGEPPHGTGILVGTVYPNFDVEIDNVVVSGDSKQYSGFTGAIGLLHVGKDRYCEISNVTVQNAEFLITTTSMTHGLISAGALIGILSPHDNAYVSIDKINVVDVRLDTKVGTLGGVIGCVQSYNSNRSITNFHLAQAPVMNAEINISNIYTNAVLCQLELNSSQPQYSFVGGVVGQLGEGDSTEDFLSRFYRGTVNIYNCYVEATIMAGYSTLTNTVYDQGAGGLLGAYSMAAGEAYVSDIILDVSFPHNKMLPSVALEDATYSADSTCSVGLIAYAGHTRLKAAVAGFTATDDCDPKFKPGADKYYECYLYVEDVVTTVQEENVAAVVHLNRKGGIHYNDVDIACGDKGKNIPHVDAGIVKVLPVEAKQMVVLDENGYIDMVVGAVAAPVQTVQVSAVAGGKANLRIVGFAAFDAADAVGAAVMIGDKMFAFDNVALLDEVNAANGVAAYTTKDFGAKKLMAITITNVPVGTETTVAWAFTYQIGDRVVTGDVTMGTLAADGTFSAVAE